MLDWSNSFVALVLRMTGLESSRGELAKFFDAQFVEVAHLGQIGAKDPAQVVAKSIALVENAHLVPSLVPVFSVQATQNILSFSKDGELNVMVVREVQEPHSQVWSFAITSNFNLFNSKDEALNIKIKARFDRELDQLMDLSIDKDEFDLEAYRTVLEPYTQYHTALNPPTAKNAQALY
jgi:hypothetical protein